MIIYGNHACRYALDAGKKIYKVYILKTKPVPRWIVEGQVNVVRLENKEFEQILPKHAVHQGIAMEVEDEHYADITELEHTPRNCAIAILDGVTDPHNMGAIIRSAVAFGIMAIIIGEKSSCKVNGIVAKSASGGIEHIKIIVVKNKAFRDKLSAVNAKIMGQPEGFDPFYGAPVVLIVLADKDWFTGIYDGSLVMGSPGKVRRSLTEEEMEQNLHNAVHYVEMSREYMEGKYPIWE